MNSGKVYLQTMIKFTYSCQETFHGLICCEFLIKKTTFEIYGINS